MLEGQRIGVVVPAHNEESLIGRVILTMPTFVDRIFVIDDASQDNTAAIVEDLIPQFKQVLTLVRLPQNQGVGAAIVQGYKKALQEDIQVVAVMAGDAQMAPEDLVRLVEPIIYDKTDYSKGNRLFTGDAWQKIPKVRYLGNAFLSLLTKVSSGYWHIADSQTGFTAISVKALKLLPIEELYPRYGYPNHLLSMLNVFNCRVRDVPVQPVYNIGEKSEINILKSIPTLSNLLLKNFVWRMTQKYVIRDFHPLIFFYCLACLLLGASIPLFFRMLLQTIEIGHFPPFNSLLFVFTGIAGLQSLFFAMWFDLDYNRHLR